MTALRDLTPCIYLPVSASHILAVGWLGETIDFPTGTTPPEVFSRLQTFAKAPWQPFVACGSHECELCQFEGERFGAANLFIPFQGKIYVCPELITHYINAHYYQPPSEFCDAVIACPSMESMEYKQSLLACNGQVLWRVPGDAERIG
jgi:hypothetical protein